MNPTAARILGSALEKLLKDGELSATAVTRSQAYELTMYANRSSAIRKIKRENRPIFTVTDRQALELTFHGLKRVQANAASAGGTAIS